MKHVLMAVSGPSGAGKGTIVKTLLQRREDVVESVSCTTREPREGEVHGKHYFFLSKEEFFRRIEENDFLEYDEHFGNYYGTPKSFVEETLKTKSVIMEIDVVGALNAKKFFPDCVLVMILPPSIEELKKRLVGRGSETAEEIENRLSRIQYEVSQRDKYDYIIVNDDLETAIAEVSRIFDGE
ncbi:MAG: guanylate kinase [Clostridia bacterium]|nr:guanylate kinase [Clostridia bacterium]